MDRMNKWLEMTVAVCGRSIIKIHMQIKGQFEQDLLLVCYCFFILKDFQGLSAFYEGGILINSRSVIVLILPCTKTINNGMDTRVVFCNLDRKDGGTKPMTTT
ncbi:hypothetical protein M9H77_16196 [Catharanthus roseus]|uniref:Uncharacterized protein n=1 Tax=Catharanthus roseus TaxID=4058 RepID=A0ACC0AZB0_CATRO|nr:hypothetical protein M9H77_16196 [Catharanthus roseus]